MMKMKVLTCLVEAFCLLHMSSIVRADLPPGVVSSEIIFDPTIIQSQSPLFGFSSFAETQGNLVVVCSGMDASGGRLFSRIYSKANQSWSLPAVIPTSFNDLPSTNPDSPALFQIQDGPLLLFYQVDVDVAPFPVPPNISYISMVTWSNDQGVNWQKPVMLPFSIGGPDRTSSIRLTAGGELMIGSVTTNQESTFNVSTTSGFDKNSPNTLGDLDNWSTPVTVQFRQAPNPGPLFFYNMTSPSFLTEANNTISAICNGNSTQSPQPNSSSFCQSQMTNDSSTWTPLALLSVDLRVFRRYSSDAITLSTPVTRDNFPSKHILTYVKFPDPNSPPPDNLAKLTLAFSASNSTSNQANAWQDVLPLTLPNGGNARFPNIFQTSDNKLHLTYRFWGQGISQIQHTVIDPQALPLDDSNSTK